MKKIPRSVRQLLAPVAAALLALNAGQAWSYSCNVSATSTGVVVDSSTANPDTNGTVTLNCTRNSAESTSLSYRIKADNGLYYSAQRRANRSGSTDYMEYILQRGTTVGGGAACANTTNWLAPATGNSNVITGTLNFGSALSASATWGYCIRVPALGGFTIGGFINTGYFAKPAGIYTDTVQITAQYPGTDGSPTTAPAALTYTIGLKGQCVFNSFPTSINFNYTSFSTTPQVSSNSFNLLCSSGEPWTAAVSPASGTGLGLNYTLSLGTTSGSGTGNVQAITLTGTMPAGQSGTCMTGSCSTSNAHTVTITY